MNGEGVDVHFDGSLITASEDPVMVREDVPDRVLDGRLGDICQRRMRRFPVAYAWPALVTAAGALIQRGNSVIRTNVYGALVGPPGSSKSQAVENAFRVLGMWPQHPALIKGKFGSAEGLIERLQDVEADAVRVVSVDELGHLLAKAAIERSSFPYILNTAYYDDQQTGGTKGKLFNFDCRLSFIGGVVEELFGDSFGMATTGGLYDRFIFGLCPEPYQHLWRPFEGDVEPLRPFPAFVDPEVWNARDEWIKAGITARVAEHALRVAYICGCADGRPALRAADLGPALAFAEYQMRVRIVLAPNPGENPDARCACAIRNWLAEHGKDGQPVARRDVDRGIHGSRFGPGVFNRCLNNLQFNDEIELDLKAKTVRWLGDSL